jgi:hypothetical protein
MANRQENDDPKNTSRIPPMAKENHLVLSLKAHLSTIKRLKLNQKKKKITFYHQTKKNNQLLLFESTRFNVYKSKYKVTNQTKEQTETKG